MKILYGLVFFFLVSIAGQAGAATPPELLFRAEQLKLFEPDLKARTARIRTLAAGQVKVAKDWGAIEAPTTAQVESHRVAMRPQLQLSQEIAALEELLTRIYGGKPMPITPVLPAEWNPFTAVPGDEGMKNAESRHEYRIWSAKQKMLEARLLKIEDDFNGEVVKNQKQITGAP